MFFFFLFHPLDLSLASFDSLFWRNSFFFFSDWLQFFSKGLSVETGNTPDVPVIGSRIRSVNTEEQNTYFMRSTD